MLLAEDSVSSTVPAVLWFVRRCLGQPAGGCMREAGREEVSVMINKSVMNLFYLQSKLQGKFL
jgi:hypothetical protein